MTNPTILFMGTPEFAIHSLDVLLRHDYPIIGVVTQPDRPKGRGRTPSPSPVKFFAANHDIPVLQPDHVKSDDFITTVRNLAPEMVIVAAFGQILPKEIIEVPKWGALNVHPSLLPKYRGAAPINWAIIRGEKRTGVTIMLMDEGMDTGEILAQEETMIGPGETFGELSNRLAITGASLLLRTVEMIIRGNIRKTPQDSDLSSYAPRLKKDDCRILWDSDVHHVVNLIRGLSPEPSAHTFLAGKLLKIFRATCSEEPVTEQAGSICEKTDSGLKVAAKNGYVFITEVQMENKKRMSIHDFMRGFRISPGDALS